MSDITGSQSDLNNLTDHTRELLLALLLLFQHGHSNLAQLHTGMVGILTDSHAAAIVIGRARVGDTAPLDTSDRNLAGAIMSGEGRFVNAFIGDIASGKYDVQDTSTSTSGTESTQEPEVATSTTPQSTKLDYVAIRQRMVSYVRKLRGTANQSWVDASPDETLFNWVTHAEDSCDECPELEKGGPYTADSLPTVPGNCDTPCLFNCRCELEAVDGDKGFTFAV